MKWNMAWATFNDISRSPALNLQNQDEDGSSYAQAVHALTKPRRMHW